MAIVFLNGEYLPAEQARISVDDRGYLFADGVYEVVRVYDGRAFRMDAHLDRLANGLDDLEIELPSLEEIDDIVEKLLDDNKLRGGDAKIYVQVTRGAAPRAHAFPKDCEPSVYVAASGLTPHPDRFFSEGVGAIRVSDTRWARCDIKSISLLPNVLANQRAHAAGAFEALFVRDGIVLEGSHSNLWGVYEETLVTYPASNHVLAGITRDEVFDIAEVEGIAAGEGLIPEERLLEADELFLSGTTTEIMPVVRVDGLEIGNGRPGPIATRLQQLYRSRTAG
ncbi:MAG TPA: D-amino-acid transaminase [Longimicrobiales bacterium]|nr:D-amino-acid transaminase [Longimicrobiales bacterium]